MPSICVQKLDLPYTEKDIIRFEEGLIGMPDIKRMVLVNQDDIQPFLWLVSLDEPNIGFLVLQAQSFFPDYKPQIPSDLCEQLGITEEGKLLILATVTIAPEWERSTTNLRAPIVISPENMRGAQIILSGSPYRLDESLPIAVAA